jgi:hypothetical protein
MGRWLSMLLGMDLATMFERLRAAAIVGAISLPSLFPKQYQTRDLRDEYGSIEHDPTGD